jgi:hypothetical protein
MPWTILLRPSVILGILLGLSVLANVGLWKLHGRDLVRIGQVTAERDQAQSAARQCSDGVERLRAASDKKAREVEAALKAASARALAAEKKVLATLQERPAIPGDDCASALGMNRKKIQERRAP